VFADKHFNEIGNRLCHRHPEIDFVAMINMGKCSISYRTIRDDINLGMEIAKKFGGGGHPKAAGSGFPTEFKHSALSIIFNAKGE
jgi:nanoRNase/pAp phosphatase (c-di-AMP/oligoRNAs hydrolase)